MIWDVSDPLAPQTIARIVNGASFHHSVMASPDGKLLVIGDENYYAHECTDAPSSLGALWVHDISDPRSPRLLSSFEPPRGDRPVGDYWNWTQAWCTAHNYNFIPETHALVSAWYAGGTSVIDLGDGTQPTEVAYWQPANAEAWSSYWYRGRIYVSDSSRGVDILELEPSVLRDLVSSGT